MLDDGAKGKRVVTAELWAIMASFSSLSGIGPKTGVLEPPTACHSAVY
jgi:hypothetical protein